MMPRDSFTSFIRVEGGDSTDHILSLFLTHEDGYRFSHHSLIKYHIYNAHTHNQHSLIHYEIINSIYIFRSV